MKRVGHYNDTEVVYRKIPIALLLVIILVASFFLFIIGLMIGYGFLHSPFGIFNPETWMHVLKLTGSD